MRIGRMKPAASFLTAVTLGVGAGIGAWWLYLFSGMATRISTGLFDILKQVGLINDPAIVGIHLVLICVSIPSAFVTAVVYRLLGHCRTPVLPLRCPQCDYSLTGLARIRCPECGVDVFADGDHRRHEAAESGE